MPPRSRLFTFDHTDANSKFLQRIRFEKSVPISKSSNISQILLDGAYKRLQRLLPIQTEYYIEVYNIPLTLKFEFYIV